MVNFETDHHFNNPLLQDVFPKGKSWFPSAEATPIQALDSCKQSATSAAAYHHGQVVVSKVSLSRMKSASTYLCSWFMPTSLCAANSSSFISSVFFYFLFPSSSNLQQSCGSVLLRCQTNQLYLSSTSATAADHPNPKLSNCKL